VGTLQPQGLAEVELGNPHVAGSLGELELPKGVELA